MSASFSLHIGVNLVDEGHYQGWNGRLYGCENDALFYYDLAKKEGCRFSTVLLSSDVSHLPTSSNVLAFLDQGVRELKAGDNLFITYSGHGGILEDKNFDEEDFQDETWCLYDRQFLDDELFKQFSRFEQGVNIFVISDSCHSGSIVKSADCAISSGGSRARVAPKQQLFSAYYANRSVYEPLMRKPVVHDSAIAASVLQLGACQDNELAIEDGDHGLFTRTLMRVFERTGAPASYQELFVRARRALYGIQRPNLVSYGYNHTQLTSTRPFGSNPSRQSASGQQSFTYGQVDARLFIRLFEEFDISQFEKYKDINKSPVAGENSRTGYQCTCSFDEAGMYPWDQVYREYFFLKSKGLRVAEIYPDGWPTAGMSLPGEFKHEPVCEIICRILPGNSPLAKGVGKIAQSRIDPDLKRLLAMEAFEIIMKDEKLEPFRTLDQQHAEKLYGNPATANIILELLKDSIYSSDTLTVHL